MKIDNKSYTDRTVVMLILLIILVIVFFLGMLLFGIENLLMLISSGAVLSLLLWRFLTLRRYHIEITEYLLVIKYNHPLQIRHRQPILELPTAEIYDIQLESSVIISFLKITIQKRKKFKTFHYRLYGITKDQRTILNKAIQSLTVRHIENEIND